MNLKNLFTIQTDNKPHVRSFRLRDVTMTALNFLSEKIGLSANEIVNVAVETLGKEYDLLNKIQELLDSGWHQVSIFKQTNPTYKFRFEIRKNSNPWMFKYEITHIIFVHNTTEFFQHLYYVNDLQDLFDFGFDGAFYIEYNLNK